MYPVSNAFLTAVKANTRKYYWTGRITTKGGAVYEFDQDDMVKGSGYITSQCCGSTEIELGTVYAAEMGISLFSDIDRYILEDAIVTLSYHLQVAGGSYEGVPMGIFEVSEANRKAKCLEIKAYDYMVRFEKAFNGFEAIGNAFDFMNLCASACKVELAQTRADIEAMPNGMENLSIYTDNDIETFRDVLFYVGQVLGGFFMINRFGQLELKKYGNQPVLTVERRHRFTSSFSDFITRYTAVSSTNLRTQIAEYYALDPDDGLTMNLGVNPLLQFGLDETREQLVRNILADLSVVNYVPFDSDTIGNPALDVGDILSFSGGQADAAKYACITSNSTVIANDYYDHFAAALQKDFNDNMNYDKNEVTAEILISTLKTSGVPREKITPELVDILKQELISAGVMNDARILKGTSSQVTKIFDDMIFADDTLYEHMENIKKQFKKLMVQKGTKKIEIRNGDNEPYENKVRAFASQGEFEQIYFALRENLMKRTMYKFKIDKDKFIDGCALEINNYLMFMKSKSEYKIEAGKAKFTESAMFVMEEAACGGRNLEAEAESDAKSDFEIVNYIMYHTMLPRLAIFKIIKAVKKRELLNNQDILDTVTQKILKLLNDTKAANITSYEVINGYELDGRNIFELDTISEEDFNDEWRVFQANTNRSSAMNEYYKLDSKGEKEFAEKLENNQNVLLFTKLKKGGFVIDTPYGNYSPDWAIVCRKDSLSSPDLGIYFIVETKNGKLDINLQEVERNKIQCGKLHFQAVSEQIRFDWVNSYEDFRAKFGVAESE